MVEKTNMKIVPVGVLRMAGFPVDLLDQFRLGKIDHDSFNEKTQILRNKLYKLFFTEEMIREAIWTSSDSVYRNLNKQNFKFNRDSKAKNFERLLTKYLFRFCYKNDTNSFFGPSCYVRFDNSQSVSIEGVIGNEITNRKNTDTYTASWAQNISPDLILKYNKARGVEEKSSILESIILETKGENMRKHWRWYNERSPIYERCPANVNITIGGKLLNNITYQSMNLSNKFKTFNAMMYNIAVNKGFYEKLYNEAYKQIKSNKLREWFAFFDSDKLFLLKEINEEMILIGKKLFQQIFIENNLDTTKIPNLKISPFFSPDIMINSQSIEEINKENYQLVIGDMHGSLTCFRKPPSCYFDNLALKSSMKLLNEDLFDTINFYLPKEFIPDIFDLSHGFKIKKDIDELQLHLNEKEISLNNSNAYVEFFYNNTLAKIIPLGAFRLDIFYPEEQERLIINDIILKRTSCKINAQEYLKSISNLNQDDEANWYALFQKTRQFFKEKNLDSVIFFKPDCEYKSLAIDLDNPFCCEILQSYAKKSKTMEFQEMLPGRNGLWLKNDKGNYTSEFRLSFYGGKNESL